MHSRIHMIAKNESGGPMCSAKMKVVALCVVPRSPMTWIQIFP